MHKYRIDEIDILRGLTFLAIVMQHSLASFMYSSDLNRGAAQTLALLLTLVRYAVPMFIFITGLVLFYNYSKKDFKYGEFLQKRFFQIFIPYLVWTLIYSVGLHLVVPRGTSFTIAKIIALTLTGEACYHLWFMVAIIQFYLLFPLFRVLIFKGQSRPALTLILSLLAYFAYISFYTYQIPMIYETTQSPWLKTLLAYRDRNFLAWFFYFILGGFAGLYAEKLKDILRAIQKYNFTIFIITYIYIIYAMFKTGHFNQAGGYTLDYQLTLPLTPVMVIFLTSSLCIFYYWSQTLFSKNQLLKETLKTFGRYSFGAYFIHPYFLYYINLMVKPYMQGMDTLSQLIISFIACSALSLSSCYLINKITIPLGTLLVGHVPRKN